MFRPASTLGAIRTRLKMSQAAFAARFGILPSTLRDWEQNRYERRTMAERDRALRYVVRISQCDRSSDAAGLQNEADLTRKTMIPRHQRHRSSRLATGRSTR